MRFIHIVAGLVALAAGAVALATRKGSPLHRRSGQVFAVAMLVMTSSAVVMAGFLSPNRVNVVAGSLTFYLVCTGWLAVRRTVEQQRRWLAGLMLLALAGSAYAFSLGFEALGNPRGIVDKVPAPPLFMFGLVGLIGGAMDARLLRAGQIVGAHRLARHLWRMTFALWIATTSFFLGQAKLFPAEVRATGLLPVPVLLVTGLLLFWLVRVYWKRRQPVAAR